MNISRRQAVNLAFIYLQQWTLGDVGHPVFFPDTSISFNIPSVTYIRYIPQYSGDFSCNYTCIPISETWNYSNSNMTWMQHQSIFAKIYYNWIKFIQHSSNFHRLCNRLKHAQTLCVCMCVTLLPGLWVVVIRWLLAADYIINNFAENTVHTHTQTHTPTNILHPPPFCMV